MKTTARRHRVAVCLMAAALFCLLVSAPGWADYDCTRVSRADYAKTSNESRLLSLKPRDRERELKRALEFAVCEGSPAEFERVLVLALKSGEEDLVDSGDFWRAVGRRENRRLAAVAARYLAREEWSDAAIDLAVRSGNVELLKKSSMSLALDDTLREGQEELSIVLGAPRNRIAGKVAEQLWRVENEERQLEIFESIESRLNDRTTREILQASLEGKDFRLAERSMSLGVIPDGDLIEELASRDHFAALQFLASTTVVPIDCADLVHHAFRGFRDLEEETRSRERWGSLFDIAVSCWKMEGERTDRTTVLPRERARTLLAAGVDPFYLELYRRTGSSEVDPDLEDARGFTGLLRALIQGDLVLAGLYLDAGADFDRCAIDRGTAWCGRWEARKIRSFEFFEKVRRTRAFRDSSVGEHLLESSIWSKFSEQVFRPRYEKDRDWKWVLRLSSSEFGDESGLVAPSYQIRLPWRTFDWCKTDSEGWSYVCPYEHFMVRIRVAIDQDREQELRFARSIGREPEAAYLSDTGRLDEERRWLRTLQGFREQYLLTVQVESSEWLAPEADALAVRVFEGFESPWVQPLMTEQIWWIVGLLGAVLAILFLTLFLTRSRGASA